MQVAICQPLVPAYRLPLFERLGSLPNIELTVFAGDSIGSLPGVATGTCFRFRSAPVRRGPLGLATQWAQVASVFQGFDLLIAPWDIHYVTLAPCLVLARTLDVSLVLWGHGYPRQPRRVTDAVRNAYGRLADGVLLYSRSVASRLVQQHGFSTERVFVANNALDQTAIQAATRYWVERPAMLQSFQLEQGLDPAQTLIFVSRLEPENRIDLLLRATLLLRQSRPGVRTVIIGDGSDRSTLERLARSLGIVKQVIFTGPVYDEIELARWMLSAALLCYPTRMGLSLLHAFGYGLPVVTTDSATAQAPELDALIDGKNGLRYQDGNIEQLAGACSRLLNDGSLRQQLSERALQTVADEYSMDTMVGGFVELFDWVRTRRTTASRPWGRKT
jgi:glycosyltransferase involved in cell wall biosynthesis